MCLNRECAKANTCLRQLIVSTVPENIPHWTIVSPTYLATLKGTCPHYRSCTKVRFAKGFIKILDNLPNKQMRLVISHLISCFGRRTYYRIRKGERLLSPAEQKQFYNILKNCSITHPLQFDGYQEEYDW